MPILRIIKTNVISRIIFHCRSIISLLKFIHPDIPTMNTNKTDIKIIILLFNIKNLHLLFLDIYNFETVEDDIKV
jgi:hypothetical protein